MRSPRSSARHRALMSVGWGFFLLLIGSRCDLMGSYRVFLKDGKVYEARTRPVSMEGQYRFTSTDGKFYAVPVSQVDWLATEAANKQIQRAAHPSKHYSNEDIVSIGSPLSSEDRSVSTAAQDKPAKGETGANPKAVGSEKGQDEAYWRKRAKALRDQMAAVDKEISDLDEKVRQKKGEGIMVGMGTYTPYIVVGINNLESQRSALQKEKERLQKEYSDLEEDARKAGAMPGWLR